MALHQGLCKVFLVRQSSQGKYIATSRHLEKNAVFENENVLHIYLHLLGSAIRSQVADLYAFGDAV